MIEAGVLEAPAVSAIFGMHVNTELATGKISYRPEVLLASVDRFRVTIRGKQSHAAMPWQGVDPIVAAAHVVTSAQSIASRKIDARDAVVVSFGIVQAGRAWNIIPGEVVLEGTVRSHDAEVRRRAVAEFTRIVEGTAEALGTEAEIQFDDYGPVVWNDPELVARAKASLEGAVGPENVIEAEPVMGGEDFAHYAQQVPGCFIFLGVRNEEIGACHPLHTPQMVVDEAALPLGVRAHCLMALDYLRRRASEAERTAR
jgi:amidohydrolase